MLLQGAYDSSHWLEASPVEICLPNPTQPNTSLYIGTSIIHPSVVNALGMYEQRSLDCKVTILAFAL